MSRTKNGQFKPGASGNPSGRPKGSVNRVTKELRQLLKAIVFDELERLPETLDELPAEKRVEVLTKIIPYALPKVEAARYDLGEPTAWEL
jgi:hypothetical protein